MRDLQELNRIAEEIRYDIVRMVGAAGSGHPGGCLSIVEILVALYFSELRHDPRNPTWPDRDRFVLSKGHGVPALYAAYARAGYELQSDLISLRKLGSTLQGHPDRRKLPILEANTGSLGQGISVGIGMALAARIDGRSYHTYVLIGDGESQEGQIWEAAAFAGFHRLDNLTVIMDYNRFQLDGLIADILEVQPLSLRWSAFGWNVLEVDGHNLSEVVDVLSEARSHRREPSIVVAHTIKGKGVSFMEDDNRWHGVAPQGADLERALEEIRQRLDSM